jgi:hypothetical protein
VAYKKDKGPGCDPKGDYIDYVVADNMFGPFTGPVRHLIYPTEDGDESVQQGICTYKGKTYIAYHVPYDNGATASNVPESWTSTTHDHHRQVAVTLLNILPDGSLQPIYPGHDQGAGTPGVTHLTLDAFAPRREAVEFQMEMNAWGEKGLKGEYQMKMGDGGYLQYHDVDFGDGASTFQVEVSSENAALRNGSLEIRLDNPAGELIGEVKIEDTGGRTNYRVLTTKVLSSAKGVHDLCLVARGEATATQRRLFNITSFGFTRR